MKGTAKQEYEHRLRRIAAERDKMEEAVKSVLRLLEKKEYENAIRELEFSMRDRFQ